MSILDVGSVDELHELLSGLPLFPYLDIRVTALARHPNAVVSDAPAATADEPTARAGQRGEIDG